MGTRGRKDGKHELRVDTSILCSAILSEAQECEVRSDVDFRSFRKKRRAHHRAYEEMLAFSRSRRRNVRPRGLSPRRQIPIAVRSHVRLVRVPRRRLSLSTSEDASFLRSLRSPLKRKSSRRSLRTVLPSLLETGLTLRLTCPPSIATSFACSHAYRRRCEASSCSVRSPNASSLLDAGRRPLYDRLAIQRHRHETSLRTSERS